jgi:hydroxymethylbilane synthase
LSRRLADQPCRTEDSLTMTVAALRIGTRASKLARWQSDWVAAALTAGGLQAEVVEIRTQGDLDQTGALRSLGGQGVFTNEIQQALRRGDVDVAVHSYKDLPTGPSAGLAVAAVGPREDPVDALVAAPGLSLASLPQGARVGTGSLRRQAQLRLCRSDLEVVGIRGNVDTRLRKLDEGQVDALVLAAAGLIRLGLAHRIVERLAPPRLLPAVGQGAVAIECRADDATACAAVAPLDHFPTRLATTAERALLAALRAGCSAPVAAWGRLVDGRLLLDALVADPQGTEAQRVAHAIELPEAPGAALAAAERLGQSAAEDLLARGAAELMRRPA